ncbi:MAG: hypothetical protein ACXVCP_04810 [Bdellovibrio sp.]
MNLLIKWWTVFFTSIVMLSSPVALAAPEQCSSLFGVGSLERTQQTFKKQTLTVDSFGRLVASYLDGPSADQMLALLEQAPQKILEKKITFRSEQEFLDKSLDLLETIQRIEMDRLKEKAEGIFKSQFLGPRDITAFQEFLFEYHSLQKELIEGVKKKFFNVKTSPSLYARLKSNILSVFYIHVLSFDKVIFQKIRANPGFFRPMSAVTKNGLIAASGLRALLGVSGRYYALAFAFLCGYLAPDVIEGAKYYNQITYYSAPSILEKSDAELNQNARTEMQKYFGAQKNDPSERNYVEQLSKILNEAENISNDAP